MGKTESTPEFNAWYRFLALSQPDFLGWLSSPGARWAAWKPSERKHSYIQVSGQLPGPNSCREVLVTLLGLWIKAQVPSAVLPSTPESEQLTWYKDT